MTALELNTKYVVKGTAFRNMKKFTDEKLGEGYFQNFMKIINPGFPTIITPSAWYPASDSLQMSVHAAKKMGVSLERYCLDQNEFNVRENLNGVYKFFLKVGGPERVLKSIPQMLKTYTNSALFEVMKNETGHFKGRAYTPKEFGEWNFYMLKGGIYGIMNALEKSIKDFQLQDEKEYQKDGEEWVSIEVEFSY